MAAWPLVKSALAGGASALSAFSDALIFIGPQTSRDSAPKKFEVGFVNDENAAGTYGRSLAYDGTVWTETGEVRSTIVAQAGDSDPSFAQGDAFDMADALDAWIRADRTLGGVLSPDSEIRTAIDVLSVSNAAGTATELVYVVTYSTTT